MRPAESGPPVEVYPPAPQVRPVTAMACRFITPAQPGLIVRKHAAPEAAVRQSAQAEGLGLQRIVIPDA